MRNIVSYHRDGIRIKGDYMFGSLYVLFISKCWNRINLLIRKDIRNIGKTLEIPSFPKISPFSSINYSHFSKIKGGHHGKKNRINFSSKLTSISVFIQIV